MTAELDTHRSLAPVAPEQAARMTASWPGLLHSPIQTKAEAVEILEGVKRLSSPATKQWISGRVATLLSQYFASSLPAEMMQAIADDWHHELKAYPAWAIQNACRWWMSEANDKRRNKPLPGDIAARTSKEMAAVKAAEYAVRRFERGSTFTPSEQERHESEDAPRADEVKPISDLVAEFTDRRAAG